jgi:hypothetical protein
VLDGDSEEEEDLDGDGIGDAMIPEEDFLLNARFLVNKIYYRQNMSVPNCTFCCQVPSIIC